MKIADNISWKSLQDKVVAVNLTSGTYYTMNVVASEIWKALADGKDTGTIAGEIRAGFDTGDADVIADIDQQIEYWTREGLLVRD